MKISVIIPALNESARIEQTLYALANQPGPCERIVVDGGSHNDTVAQARSYVRVIVSALGGARQMNAGAAAARGEVLLFLHADIMLPPDAFTVIRSILTDPRVESGAFRLAFDVETPLLRFYSFCTCFALPRICFGFRFLSHVVTTSARRFEQYGPFRQQLRNTYLWLLYQTGTAPDCLVHLYPYEDK